MADSGGASPSVTPQPPASGEVLSQHDRDIGHGFREVRRSQANSAGSFEAVGHFVFVYYGQELVCQCSEPEIAISPDGAHAIFTEPTTGRLILFDSQSSTRREISRDFVGYPKHAAWDLGAGRVHLTLEKFENGAGRIVELDVEL